MAKQDRLIQTRKRLARLPFHKTLEDFEFSFQPSIDEKRVRELAILRFMGHQENLVFLGPPRVGKTHLAVAIGLEVIDARQTVYLPSAHDMIQVLEEAHHRNQIHKNLQVYTEPDLLILVEMGHRRMDETAGHFFFQIISER